MSILLCNHKPVVEGYVYDYFNPGFFDRFFKKKRMAWRKIPVFMLCLVSALTYARLPIRPSILRGGGPRMMFNMFTEPKLIEPEKALPGREAPMRVSDRHAVLGSKMKGPWPAGHKVAVFANGCFWGSEKGIWRLPGDGIYTTAVGYAAGFTPNPTYEEACSGRTGHTEAVQVVYDPEKVSFVDILRWFWEAHDPTSGMGQGNDRGTQYRSGFYWFDDEQKALIEASKAAYGKALGKSITTETAAASDYDKYGGVFYYGEDYHQQYLAKPMARPYCSAQPQCVSLPPFEEWAPPGLEHHAPKLPEAFWKRHGPKPHCVIRSPDEPIKWGDW